jgi:subtilase family serine protease
VPPPPGQPDLIISELYVDPANPAYGASGAAYFTIRNRGNAQAGQSVLYYQWGPGGSEVGQAQVPALAAGAEHSLGANVGPFYASFEVWGVIDAGSAVAESNEDNNRRTFMVNVAAAQPDLTISDLNLDPSNPGPGEHATAKVKIVNNGSGAAGFFQVWYQWGYDIDTNVCVWQISGGLGAGESDVVSCDAGPFWASYDTVATIDYYLQVDESDENNNMFGLPVYLP